MRKEFCGCCAGRTLLHCYASKEADGQVMVFIKRYIYCKRLDSEQVFRKNREISLHNIGTKYGTHPVVT